MAVVASFTAVPSGGLLPPSEAVQFTDTSTGSPDNWLWNFGDGETSNEQHPLHTFVGSIGQIFTVKLIAWISAGTNSVGMSLVSPRFELTPAFAGGTNAIAWSLFDPPNYSTTNWPTGPTKFILNSLNPNFAYAAIRETRSMTMPAGPTGAGPSVFIIEVNLDVMTGDRLGTVISDIGGTISGTLAPSVWHSFLDVTSRINTTFQARFEPTGIVQLPDPPLGTTSGIQAAFRLLEYRTGGAEDYNEVENDIAFGVSPVADFTASPTAGTNPLSVQFENLTTVAIGLPTTYSWKKRLSGTADPYVQFSTEENPLEDFTK